MSEEYPEVAYYQGMNYIAGYLYYTFEDEELAYKFLCFIVEEYVSEFLGDGLDGVLKLTYVLDKCIETTDGFMWYKLAESDVKSVHFTVSIFLTLFTTYITDKSLYPVVDRIWDIFITDGYRAIIGLCLFLIQI